MDSQDRSGFAGRLAEPIYNLTPENYDSLHRAVSEHLSQQNRINSPEGEQMPRSSIPEGQNFRNWSLQGCNNNNSTLQESSLQQDVSKNRSLGSSSEDLQQLFLRSSGNPLAALLQQQLLTMRLQQSGSSEPNLVGLGTSTTASGGNIATTGLSSFVNGAGQSAEGSPFLQMAPSAVSLASNASLQPSGQESLIGSAPRVGASSSGMCVFGNYAASSSEQLQAASGFPTGVLGSTSTLPMIPQPTSFSGFYPELPQVTPVYYIPPCNLLGGLNADGAGWVANRPLVLQQGNNGSSQVIQTAPLDASESQTASVEMVARELLNASQSHLLNQDQADASQANNRSGTLAGQHQEQGHQPGPGGGAFRTNVPEFVPRSTESGAGVTAEGGAYRAPLEFRPENRREQQGGSNASLPANGGGIGNYSQGYQMNGSGTTGYNSAKSVSSTAMKGTGEGPAGSHAVADNRNSKLQSSSRQGQGQGQGQQQHEFSGTSKGGPGGNDGNGNGKGGSSMNKGVPSASSKGTSNGKMNVEQMGGSASRYSDSPSRYNNPAAGDRSPYNQQLNGTGPTTSSSSRGGKMNSKGTSKGGYNAYDDRGPFGFDGGPRGGYDDDCGGCDRDYMYLSKSRAGPPDKGGSSSSRDKIMTSGGGYMKGGPGNKAAPPKGDIRSTRYPQDYDYPPGADQRITTAWGKSFEKNDMGSAGGGSKGLTGSTGKGKGGGPSSGAKGDTMMKGGLMQPSTSSSKGDGTQPDGGKRITAHKGVEYKHNMVPRNKDLLEEYGHTMSEKPITTLMIRNIPNRYTQKQFIQELDAIGFKNTYNFAYLPIDRSTESSVGYAFVNFRKPSDAVRALQIFGEYRFQRYRNVSSKIGTVSVAHIQGLDNNIKHYKKSVIADEKNSFRPFVLREPPEGSVSPSNKGRRARKHSRKNKNTPAPAEAGAEGDAAGDEEYADAVSVKEDRGDGGEKENPEQEPQETNNEKDASSSSSTPAGSSKKNKNENTAGAGTYDSSTTTDQEQAGATACTSLLASASATAPTEGTTTEGSDKKDKNAASSDPVPASNEDA